MVGPHQSHWRLHYFSEKWWYVTLQSQDVLKPSGPHESPSEVVMAFLLAALMALVPNDSKPLRLSVARLWMMQSQGPETCSGEMKTVSVPANPQAWVLQPCITQSMWWNQNKFSRRRGIFPQQNWPVSFRSAHYLQGLSFHHLVLSWFQALLFKKCF